MAYPSNAYFYSSNAASAAKRAPSYLTKVKQLQTAASGSTPTKSGAAPAIPQSVQYATTPSVDWGNIINEDPTLKGLKLDLSGESISDAASRSAITRQALANFGRIPDLASLRGLYPNIDTDVDDTTRQLAEANTAAGTSTIGRLNQQQGTDLASLRAMLASRGTLGAGDEVVYGEQLGRQYRDKTLDAEQGLLQTLGSAQSTYAAAERSRGQQLREMINAAAGRAAENPANYAGTGTAKLNKSLRGPDGQSVYVDGNGHYWTADGAPLGKEQVGPPAWGSPTLTGQQLSQLYSDAPSYYYDGSTL